MPAKTITADGASDWFQVRGKKTIWITGDFGNGSVQIVTSPNKTDEYEVPEADGGVHTENGPAVIDAGDGGMFVKAVMSGATSPDVKVTY
jgi:hypothetical protein